MLFQIWPDRRSSVGWSDIVGASLSQQLRVAWVTQGVKARSRGAGSPYSFQAVHITAQQFEAWWRWRILGLPPQEMSAACPLCGSLCAPTAKHLTSVCSASGALMDDGTPFPKHELFGRPTCADGFMARLVVVGRILAANS